MAVRRLSKHEEHHQNCSISPVQSLKVNAITVKYGFAYIMEDIDKTNSRQFLSKFGQRCEDCFVQNWHASLGNDLHRRHGGRNKL